MNLLRISAPPHIATADDTGTIMFDVILSLMPAMIAGAYFFGYRAIIIALLSVAASVAFEHLWNVLLKRPTTIGDLSAVVSGLLLAMNLPVTVPLWLPVVGSFFMIIIVKMCFGGLGQNFMNPALAGRAFLLASWPTAMTRFLVPGALKLDLILDYEYLDAFTSATPLSGEFLGKTSTWDLFLGNVGGCIGETSALALLLGAAYLLVRNIITWKIPVCFIGTVFLMSWMLGEDPLQYILCGGLLLGAFFMATDYTTSATTPWGQVVYAVGCGLLTIVIRRWGGYPEGVSYSILLMNVAAPLIDKITPPRVFGRRAFDRG